MEYQGNQPRLLLLVRRQLAGALVLLKLVDPLLQAAATESDVPVDAHHRDRDRHTLLSARARHLPDLTLGHVQEGRSLFNGEDVGLWSGEGELCYW